MKRILERELKFDADPGFAIPELGGRPIEPRVFTSTYHDTADGRLFACGITLRRRVENRAGVWQLKLPSEGGRFELEEPGGPTRVPPVLLDLLPALLRGGATLEPVAKLRTRRAGSVVTRDREKVEVVLDSVDVLDGTRVASRFSEIEAEAIAGDGTALRAIGKELRRAGARRGDGTTKLARVLPSAPAPAPLDETEPLTRLRSLLVEQYGELLRNDPGVRLGADSEALHQSRVGTRRARALLRAGADLVEPGWAEALQAELKWLGGLLGPVRDFDVLLLHLADATRSLERDDARALQTIRSRLGRQRAAARRTLLAAMSEQRYFDLLDALAGARDAPASDDVTTTLEGIAEQAFRRSRKAMKALPQDPADEELHGVRIETKRARYAAELAEPALGKKGARFVARAKEVQDVIGDHQDACIAEARIRELAVAGGARSALAAGRLIERQRKRKQEARAALPAALRTYEKAGKAAFS